MNPNLVTLCSSCVALFRECSLAQGEKWQPVGFETVTPVLGHLQGAMGLLSSPAVVVVVVVLACKRIM